MRRLCERPGCAGQAEVSYGIDHSTLVVWVDNKAVSERDHAGRLCRRHANALSVPRGWTIDDRRELVPKLFVVKTSDEDEAPPAKKKKVASAEKKPKKAATRPRPSLFEAMTRNALLRTKNLFRLLTNTLKTPTRRVRFRGRRALHRQLRHLMMQRKMSHPCLGVFWVVLSDNARQKNNS